MDRTQPPQRTLPMVSEKAINDGATGIDYLTADRADIDSGSVPTQLVIVQIGTG